MGFTTFLLALALNLQPWCPVLLCGPDRNRWAPVNNPGMIPALKEKSRLCLALCTNAGKVCKRNDATLLLKGQFYLSHLTACDCSMLVPLKSQHAESSLIFYRLFRNASKNLTCLVNWLRTTWCDAAAGPEDSRIWKTSDNCQRITLRRHRLIPWWGEFPPGKTCEKH